MKFASVGHLLKEDSLKDIPADWVKDNYIISPELNINGTKGHIFALKRTASQIMQYDLDTIRGEILDCILFAEHQYNIDIIQLGALTTSVTSGGKWVVDQNKFNGFINHGDSYTAAVTYQTVLKAVDFFDIKPEDSTISIIGAYGIIGEALSLLISPHFNKTILIGRRKEKLFDLQKKIKEDVSVSINLDTKDADVIITATNHPTALLQSSHLKKNCLIIDVSQPPNLSKDLCLKRRDIHRVDGGFVTFPYNLKLPTIPKGKILSCIAEVIMQALENDNHHHIGSIDLSYLEKTIQWGKKYGFIINELTNFGIPL